jgi:hypothetical protein
MDGVRARLVHNPVLAQSWLAVPSALESSDHSEPIPGVGAELVLRRAVARLGQLDPGGRVGLECLGPGMERPMVRRLAGEVGRHLVARPEQLPYERLAEPMRRLAARLENGTGAALIERLDRREVHVAVVAAMSSGKSTLVNAMIGRPLLPTGNRATTAKLTLVRDIDGQEGFEGTAYGAEGEVLAKGRVDRARLREWNQNRAIDRVELAGDLTWIDERRHSSCVLVDTPGPNYARDDRHKARLDELLSGTGGQVPDLALFVMDVSRLQARDDVAVLQRLLDSVTEWRVPWEELILVVANRKDEWDEEEDGDLRAELVQVAEDLKRGMGLDIGTIHPVSGWAALLARRSFGVADPPLDAREQRAFDRLISELDRPPSGWFGRLRWRFRSPARRLWHSSGLPEIHEVLREKIELVGPPLRLHRCLRQLVESGTVAVQSQTPVDVAGLVACLEQAADAAGGVR